MDERRLAEILSRIRGGGGEVEGPNLALHADPKAEQKLKQRPQVVDLMDTLGVTTTDVLRIFGGGRVLCRHCSKQKSLPAWRKGGKIVRRIWADGRYDWGCHYCGRVAGYQ